jgi:hypothetical protein
MHVIIIVMVGRRAAAAAVVVQLMTIFLSLFSSSIQAGFLGGRRRRRVSAYPLKVLAIVAHFAFSPLPLQSLPPSLTTSAIHLFFSSLLLPFLPLRFIVRGRSCVAKDISFYFRPSQQQQQCSPELFPAAMLNNA